MYVCGELRRCVAAANTPHQAASLPRVAADRRVSAWRPSAWPSLLWPLWPWAASLWQPSTWARLGAFAGASGAGGASVGDLQAPVVDRRDEASVVALRLVGVGLREPPHRVRERSALADVAEDVVGVSGAAVRQAERVAAAIGVADQRAPGEPRRVDGPLHVLELTHVEAAPVKLRPAEEGVADALHQPAPHHDALAVGQPGLLAERRLDRGELGLLDLQQQLVAHAVAHEQHDVVVGAHAADADHLVGDVDHVVAPQIGAAFRRQRLEVQAQGRGDRRGGAAAYGRDHRRVEAQPRGAVDHLRVLAHRPRLRALDRLGDHLVHERRHLARPDDPAGHRRVGADHAMAASEPAQTGHLVEGRDVGPRRGANRLLRAPRLAVLAGRQYEAGGQALEVPAPRPLAGLVEVVDVEHGGALGRGVHAEVGQVCVAAHLRVDPGVRLPPQIGGHELRGAAVERERRDRHARGAQRDQARLTRRRDRHHHVDGIAFLVGRLPHPQRPPVQASAGLRARGALLGLRRPRLLEVDLVRAFQEHAADGHRGPPGTDAPAGGATSLDDFER